MNGYNSIVLSTKDKEQWEGYVDKLSLKSPKYYPQYSKVFEKNFGYEAQLFVYGEPEQYVVYPFWKININKLDFYRFHDPLNKNTAPMYDILSPEYSGPAIYSADGKPSDQLLDSFFPEFDSYCLENNIVTEFIRLDPIAENHAYFNGKEGLRENRPIVYLDLRKDLDSLWDEFEGNARRNYRRSQQAGVKITTSPDQDSWDAFFDIYTGTMQRRNANEYYFFSKDFFNYIKIFLNGNFTLFVAHYNNEPICASICLHRDDYMFYYLGGMKQEFSATCPNNAIIFEAIKWAKDNGCKYFILGGSYQPNDGLFRFKKSFSKTVAPFFTYKKIHIEEFYQQLCVMRDAYDRQNGAVESEDFDFFPSYRRC